MNFVNHLNHVGFGTVCFCVSFIPATVSVPLNQRIKLIGKMTIACAVTSFINQNVFPKAEYEEFALAMVIGGLVAGGCLGTKLSNLFLAILPPVALPPVAATGPLPIRPLLVAPTPQN